MRACESDSDRLLKVRYLSEKGAECLMTDEVRFCCQPWEKSAFRLFRKEGRPCFMPSTTFFLIISQNGYWKKMMTINAKE